MAEKKKSKFGNASHSLAQNGEFVEFFSNVKSKTKAPQKMPDENEIHERMVVRSITNGSGRGRSGSR